MSSSSGHSRGQRPGAMTMAMQAVSAQGRPRVLRVGVVSGARIVEERVLDGRAAVTVGRSEACTFTVAGEGAPARFELFALEGGRYQLQFAQGMDGRVATPQGVLTLEQLRASGRAVRTSGEGVYRVALDEQSRGKVTVGEATFLFQFVVAPPAQPRPQLPVAIRARPMRSMDWGYNACFAGFMFIAFTALGYVEYGYDPDVQDNFTLAAPLVTAVANPPDATPVEPVQPVEAMAAPTAPAQPGTEPSDEPRNPSHHPGGSHGGANNPTRTADQRAADAIREAEHGAAVALHALANSAEWVALTTAANNAHGSAHDGMAQGGTMHVDPTVLANAGGVLPGGAHAGLTRRGDTTIALNGGNDLGRSHVTGHSGDGVGDTAPTGPVAPVGVARPGAPRISGGEGELDAAAVARVIGSSLGGIRTCYNVELRRNPLLSGRLSVSFTIGPSGRILGMPSTSGVSQSPELGTCVASRIRGLVFPAPQGGSVSFTFPFTFDANTGGR